MINDLQKTSKNWRSSSNLLIWSQKWSIQVPPHLLEFLLISNLRQRDALSCMENWSQTYYSQMSTPVRSIITSLRIVHCCFNLTLCKKTALVQISVVPEDPSLVHRVELDDAVDGVAGGVAAHQQERVPERHGGRVVHLVGEVGALGPGRKAKARKKGQ